MRKTIRVMSEALTVAFDSIDKKDIAIVGGKNASLGELIHYMKPLGMRIPDGFATTAGAFRLFLDANGLMPKLRSLMERLDITAFSNLQAISEQAKTLILSASIPSALEKEIAEGYGKLCAGHPPAAEVAVRSSATAEDLPDASFAGLHESFLNVRGSSDLMLAVKRCFASLYNARAIKYRHDKGFDHEKVALSVGIQPMVRSDNGCAGVCFTIEPDSGFRNVVVVSGCWGLGENVVQGTVDPDEFHVFKPSLGKFAQPVISRKMGSKAKTMIYAAEGSGTVNTATPPERQRRFVLSDEEVVQLAGWACEIEKHYGYPMDIEWARDGRDEALYIVQARPETVQAGKSPYLIKEYKLEDRATPLVSGSAVGSGIVSGMARLIATPAESDKLKDGEILVTDVTNPDWDPLMKRARAIVTNRGGRTSHAAIVAREMGTLALVGAAGADRQIRDGEEITLDLSRGRTGYAYRGALHWSEHKRDVRNVVMPATKPMMIVADPEAAYKLSFYPNQGVGLLRMEFAVSNSILVHPMALAKYDKLQDAQARQRIDELTAAYPRKRDYFIDKLSQAVGTIAAAFYPKDVIVRMSDFKTNEYANLIGGKEFEPREENPMLGFRGAARYYNDRYREGFGLECSAMKVVREKMGLRNVKLMIPFCRTVEEAEKVLAQMEAFGLKRGENGLEIYMMVEIPSNVILAESFAALFDGFSIGSNDLTQLTLGIDRDSADLSDLFSENNAAVKDLIAQAIHVANEKGIKIGLCGQAPSDDPEFTAFLVRQRIGSISFNPDAVLKGIANINRAEELLRTDAKRPSPLQT